MRFPLQEVEGGGVDDLVETGEVDCCVVSLSNRRATRASRKDGLEDGRG